MYITYKLSCLVLDMYPKKNHWKCHISFEGEKENIDDILPKKKENSIFKKYTQCQLCIYLLLLFLVLKSS